MIDYGVKVSFGEGSLVKGDIQEINSFIERISK